MSDYISAFDHWSHIATWDDTHLGCSLINDDRTRLGHLQSSILLRSSQIIYTYSDESLTTNGYTDSWEITLGNENKLTFDLEVINNTIQISVGSKDPEGNQWESSDLITISSSITIPLSNYDALRKQWLLNGMEVVILEKYITFDDGQRGYETGLGLIPVAMDEGVVYPREIPLDYTATNPIWWILPVFSDESSEVTYKAVEEFLRGSVYIDIEYDDGDQEDSPSGGGGGSYSWRNDIIDFPSLPTLQAINTGFISLYAPTASQLQAIADWLWSPSFFDAILKNYSDPFNNILGLWISPTTPRTMSSELRVGNVASGLSANKVSDQYGVKNCGKVTVSKYYNSFADYEQFRQFKMFLPYYGIVDISTDDFIGGSLEVEYNIDYFTGTAAIHIRSNRNGRPHVLHSYSCNLYASIPFSGINMMSYYQSLVNGVLQIGGATVSGNPVSAINGVIDIIGAKPNYAHSSGMGANSGLMGIQHPYLIDCRSVRDMPSDYGHNQGITTNKTVKLSTLSGYTEIDAIIVKIPKASDSINDKIKQLLMEGVIL